MCTVYNNIDSQQPIPQSKCSLAFLEICCFFCYGNSLLFKAGGNQAQSLGKTSFITLLLQQDSAC